MKNISLLLIFAFLLFMHSIGLSQSSGYAKNAIYLEGLGNALFYSINYERSLGNQVFARGGFEISTLKSEQNGTTENEGTFITIPVMVNHLSGTGNHHLELGGGITIITFSENDPDEDLLDLSSGSAVAATATVGYRYQKPEGGFLFKIGFTPLTNFDVFLPWGGISLGYAF